MDKTIPIKDFFANIITPFFYYHSLILVHSLMPYTKVGKSDIAEDELKVIEWCKYNGWKYVNDSNVQGTEDECIVILTRPLYLLYPEYLSRARNLLIIITTIGPGVSDIAK